MKTKFSLNCSNKHRNRLSNGYLLKYMDFEEWKPTTDTSRKDPHYIDGVPIAPGKIIQRAGVKKEARSTKNDYYSSIYF